MSGASEPVGTLEVALNHAARLLATTPAAAAEQAAEILKVVPEHPQATLLLGVARRRTSDASTAVSILEPLAAKHPNWAAAHYELGLALGANRQGEAAVTALRRALQLNPEMGEAWRALGDHLTAIGDAQGADAAYAEHIRFSSQDPRLMEAGAALFDNRIAVAEALLREHLKQFPTDVAAIRMLAEVAARIGRMGDSETLLKRCLELAPSFTAARHNLALVLHRQHRPAEALVEVGRLLDVDARNPGYRNLKAAILSAVGEYDQAIDIYACVLAEYPKQAKAWLSYGHALKTAGRQDECISAYRKSIDLTPGLGEAYWSLANMKTFRFSPSELDAMRAQLKRSDLSDEDRYHFHFAIGKALEDSAVYAESFENYANGNRLRRATIRYDAAETSAHVQRSKAVFSKQFFAERAGAGAQAPDPIFIVGLPRAGSTLLEQILSSHPAVEGTMELPDIAFMAGSLRVSKTREGTNYLETLAKLTADDLRALGQKYIEQTRIQRKTDAPFFIDKMPNNFAHVGLIHLILPNAKIIDARRHPLGCCLSNFKQHFARGQHFTYSLEDVGRYYRDYVDLMAHFDGVLPGRVHRVIYEQMIDDTPVEVRRLLEYCSLSFDERCLRFYENERAVRTASSEQVRQPIFRDAVEHWRHYDPWLGPLREALGPVLDAYPKTPES
ncbi:MAG TPA: sulfotransferase [Steroidobacter sp.]|jgi:tetratricopeptide (TPR) repeat protein|nr:sulfotransferase [Steroidobacter sp.]